MPGLNSGQIRVAGSGAIWKAPLGTVLPTDSTTAWGAGFVNLGYATDGFGMKQDLKTQEIGAWQSLEPVRIVNTALTRTFSFELEQSNADTLSLAWGGANVTPGTGGAYTLALPDPASIAEFIIGIDWFDGATSQRIIVQRATLTSLPEIKYLRTDAVKYALEFQAVKPADGSDSVLVLGTDAAIGGV